MIPSTQGLAALFVTTTLAACGVAKPTSSVASLSSSTGPVILDQIDDIAGDASFGWHFHVDVLVKKLSYQKTVSATWTVDNWQTTNVCSLAYEGDVNADDERWGSDCGKAGTQYDVEDSGLAVSAQLAGSTYWDNNNGANYRIDTTGRDFLPGR